eukprot:4261509-Pyramimonas_sp.AAC.1
MDHVYLPRFRMAGVGAPPPHRRCIGDVSVGGISGSTSSRIGDALAMRHDPPTPSTQTPCGRPGTQWPSIFLQHKLERAQGRGASAAT